MGESLDPTTESAPVLRVFQSKVETRAFYDKISGVYDLLAERSEAPVRRIGLQTLAAQPGEAILEIGFGTGHSLTTVATAVGPTGHVYGVDLSMGMARRALQVLEKAQLKNRVSLLCGDGERLCIQSDAMSGVFMSFALELFDTPAIPVVLSECLRVLRRGGRLVVVGLSKEAPPGIALEVFEWTHQHFPNLLDCRPIYVTRAVREAGFRVIDTRIENMWVPVEIVHATKGGS